MKKISTNKKEIQQPLGENRLSREDRDQLIVDFQQFVEQVVGHLITKHHLPVTLRDELMSSGYLGLVEAADRYDPRAAGAFKAFAFLRIRGAIIDNIRKNSTVSGDGYKKLKALQRADELREEMLHDEQIAKERAHNEGDNKDTQDNTDTRTRLAALLEYAGQAGLAFRIDMAEADSEASVTAEDVVITPEEELESRSEKTLFRKLIAELPEVERTILMEHYFEDLSFKEICARHPEHSKSWVSKIHQKALSKLHCKYLNAQIKTEPLATEQS